MLSWCSRSLRPGRVLLNEPTPRLQQGYLRLIPPGVCDRSCGKGTGEEIGSVSRCPQGLWAFRLQIPSGPKPIPVKTRRRFPLMSPRSWLPKHRKIQQMQLLSLITPKPAGTRLLNSRGGCRSRTLPYPARGPCSRSSPYVCSRANTQQQIRAPVVNEY